MGLFIDRQGVRVGVALTERHGFRIAVWADTRDFPSLLQPSSGGSSTVPDWVPALTEPWTRIYGFSLGGREDALVPEVGIKVRGECIRNDLRDLATGRGDRWQCDSEGRALVVATGKGLSKETPFFMIAGKKGWTVGCPVTKGELETIAGLLTSYFELDGPIIA